MAAGGAGGVDAGGPVAAAGGDRGAGVGGPGGAAGNAGAEPEGSRWSGRGSRRQAGASLAAVKAALDAKCRMP